MKIELLEGPWGVKPAIDGLRLSYDTESDSYYAKDFDTKYPYIGDKDEKLLEAILSKGSNSESKFLRQIIVYLKIKAPRNVWQQIDTYRFGVEKQSASTMHTILKKELTNEDFEDNGADLFIDTIDNLNSCIHDRDFERLKNNLPESFLQERIVMIGFQALRNIYKDRQIHKLPQWRVFCAFIDSLPYSWMITWGLK